MPTRPTQHQLETESRNALESLLGSWVYRPKVPDYGIDGDVEIFDQNGKASGLQFLVQLKAAQRAKKRASISMSVEWIRYYHSLELPVLLVLWTKESGATCWRWASDVDLYYAKPKGKSITVHLPNVWDSGTREQLRRHVKFQRLLKAGTVALPLAVSVQAPERPGVRFQLQRLSMHVPRLLTYSDQSDVTFALRKDELKISFAGYFGAVLHTMREVDDALVAKRALIGLVLALDHFGATNEAAELWEAFPDFSADIASLDSAHRVLATLAKAGAYTSLRSTILALRARFSHAELALPLLALLFTAPQHRVSELTQLLIEMGEEVLKKETTAEGRSIASYTLGRLWEGTDKRKGRKYFAQAIRASSFYNDKPYFWSELGATLFNRQRYRAALCCYERAYKKLGKTDRRCRYGDALMHAGKYGEALAVFEEIAKSGCDHTEDKDDAHLDIAEAQIKKYALEYIKEAYGIVSQDRQRYIAEESIGPDSSIPADEMLARCEKAIRMDALCSRAWFNQAVSLYKQGKLQESQASFLVAGATNTSNDEAWLNALMLGLQLNQLQELNTLLIYLTHERGNAFVQYMAESAQGRSNDRERAMLMKLASMLGGLVPKQRTEALIRLHGPKGTEVIRGPAR